jgi:hypothetical protein
VLDYVSQQYDHDYATELALERERAQYEFERQRDLSKQVRASASSAQMSTSSNLSPGDLAWALEDDDMPIELQFSSLRVLRLASPSVLIGALFCVSLHGFDTEI